MQRILVLLFIFLLSVILIVAYYQKVAHKQGTQNQVQKPTVATCNALTISSPKNGQQVTSPLTVTVIVDNTKSCHWTVFEAQAGTLSLKDSGNQTIGTGVLKTASDWMTDKPVTYTGTITFSKPATNDLTLTITEENPSGKGAQTVTIPLTY